MNIIKGLVIKDLLQLKSYKKTLVMFIIIFILTSVTQDNIETIGSMLTIMMAFGFGMFSLATFNYDEQAKADRYFLTFPLTKKEIVLSKYILVGIATVIGAIIGMLGSIMLIWLMSNELPDVQELISVALGGILGLGIVQGIQIPCIYKYGAERGRIQVFIIIAIITLLLGGILYMGDKLNIKLTENNVLNLSSAFLPIILIVLIVIVYYISYQIAYKIYSKKEV